MLGNWIKRNFGMVSFLAFMILIMSSLIYSFGNGQRRLSDIVIHIIEKIPIIEKKVDSLVQYSKNNLKPKQETYVELTSQINNLNESLEREKLWIELQTNDKNTDQILTNYQGLITGFESNLNKQSEIIIFQSNQLNSWQVISKLQNLDQLKYTELNEVIKASEKILEQLDYNSIKIQDINEKAKILGQIEEQKIITLELSKISRDKEPDLQLTEGDKQLVKEIYKGNIPSIPDIAEIKRELVFNENVENNRQAIITQLKTYLK